MPARVPAQAKELIVDLVGDAVRGGGSHRWACSLLGVSDDRVHRWRRRLRDTASLEDRRPGGVALHALRPSEIAEILAVVEQWGPVDRAATASWRTGAPMRAGCGCLRRRCAVFWLLRG